MASDRIASARSASLQMMTHVVVGYPSLEDTFELVMAMVESGVGAIELQIPFSDPVADGPVILRASQYALDHGTRVADAFMLVQRLRAAGVSIPLLFMTYANIVMAYSIDRFVKESAEVGIDGFIIPDLPLDTPEGAVLYNVCEHTNTEMIPLYAPTMTDERYTLLGKYSKNLVYAVSRTGITGVAGMGEQRESYLKKIRSCCGAQIALGFGIQSMEQVHSLVGLVDYAVVGSYILQLYETEGLQGVKFFLQSFKNSKKYIKNI